jgi:GNAT superfamily N-acetyltransferase
VRIERLEGTVVNEMGASLTDVYGKAWAETGFFEVQEELRGFSERFHRHTANPGFRLCVMYKDEQVVGFGYGYSSAPGGWWRQMVASGLPSHVAEEWFRDCFEFAELAVVPGDQGRGIGAALHDRLLDELPHHRAILSTQKENRRAVDFYSRRGWTVVDDEFFFPNRLYPYVIMGLVLSGEQETPLGPRSRKSPDS